MSAPYAAAPGPLGARLNLSRFVREQAERAAEVLGFGWIGTPEAPSTYQQLRAAFAHSNKTGEPLPISDQFCDDTIYLEPADNVAFRFWHDTSHCDLGLSFSLPDEWELALWHLDQLSESGLGPKTYKHALLRSDLLGQVVLLSLIQRYPFNQGEFTRRCADIGFDAGVLAEMRRVP